ncbi:MAG: endonuclease/exonuclease/phosphatase family protein [Alphaproteobacteria bacterium]|nr:endonuclease/exonuclease/phosphatase family protein [Alphaproteobacteria bacterium]
MLPTLLLLACADPTPGDSAPTDSATAAPSPLSVASFNVRYGSLTGDEAWYGTPGRREHIAGALEALGADLLGLQEPLVWQVEDIAELLPEHAWIGVGRDDGVDDGEYAAIFYREDRLTLLESGHFWLSETPDTPGTVFEGSGAVRMATWGRFELDGSGRHVLALNTHWDHVSASSREASAALIRQRLALLLDDDALVVTGDLNANEDSAAVQALLAGDEGAPELLDAYRSLHPEPDGQEATFHGFTGATAGLPIDFVLHDAQWEAQDAELLRWSDEGVWPSDHYPVRATLDLR